MCTIMFVSLDLLREDGWGGRIRTYVWRDQNVIGPVGR
jgi:hypothetical protein